MKTLKILISAIITLSALVLFGNNLMAADSYKVDKDHSTATFKVSNFYVSKVSGSFSDISGDITEDTDNPARSSVEIIIKTESVNTHIQKRDNHLRSADFFDVKIYPTMSFKSNKVEKLKNGDYRVTGDFNLHGITKPVTVDVKKLAGAVFETKFSINRSDYGITYDPGVIGDKIAISLHIVGVKN
jgi:polyisoprenoid-binding protein YceI